MAKTAKSKPAASSKTAAPSKPAAPAKPGTAVATVPGQTAKTTLRGHIKQLGARAKAAGVRAAAHVSRNKAAYITGGLGAAGVAGLAAASRKKPSQEG